MKMNKKRVMKKMIKEPKFNIIINHTPSCLIDQIILTMNDYSLNQNKNICLVKMNLGRNPLVQPLHSPTSIFQNLKNNTLITAITIKTLKEEIASHLINLFNIKIIIMSKTTIININIIISNQIISMTTILMIVN